LLDSRQIRFVLAILATDYIAFVKLAYMSTGSIRYGEAVENTAFYVGEEVGIAELLRVMLSRVNTQYDSYYGVL
jgi:hypothetical protein